MALSKATKKQYDRRLVQPKNDYYPDRSATDLSIVGDAMWRLPFDKFTRTSEDVHKIMTWQYGDDEIGGTFAKNDAYYQQYKRDVQKAVDEKNDYKDFYVDTFRKVSDQLKVR